MSTWFNYPASLKILIFGLLIGGWTAGAVRSRGAGGRRGRRCHQGSDGAAAAHKNPALTALSWALYALALTAVVIGVLYIARDFIARAYRRVSSSAPSPHNIGV